MAKLSSSGFKVFMVDGINMLGVKPKSLSDKTVNVIQGDTHGLGDEWAECSAIGMQRGELVQAGAFFDTVTGGVHTAFKDVTNTTSRVLVYAPYGNTIGRPFVGFNGIYEGAYDVISQVGKLAEANAAYAVTGQVDRGLIIQDWTQKSGDFDTFSTPVDLTTDPSNIPYPITSNSMANPTVITTPVPHKLTTGEVILISGVSTSSPTINGERTVTVISSTTFSVPVDTSAGAAGTGGSFVRCSIVQGGVGYLAVSECTGFTNFAGSLQHSADNSSYSTLLNFTDNVADPFAERKAVAATVQRYIRFSGDVTGSGTITPFVGFKRNAPI